MVKTSPANAGDIRDRFLSLDWEDPGGKRGNPLSYYCLENPMDRERSLVCYSPCGRKELDTTE